MNINEASEITGLSKKTLRFYEQKGLFAVSRQDNSYREYDCGLIGHIMKIKALRSIGISVIDILLWQNDMVSLESLFKARAKALQRDQTNNFQQSALCNFMLNNCSNWDLILNELERSGLNSSDEAKETVDAPVYTDAPVAAGIDIGTTTISLAVINSDGSLADVYNIPNKSSIIKEAWHNKQDPEIIYSSVSALLSLVRNTYRNITAIGITGQMHGILYVDSKCRSVSPLYTWQDKCGDRQAVKGKTYCDLIYDTTKRKVPSGYGLATHFYLQKNRLIPETAVKICTIMDYIYAKLVNAETPVMHVTNAASLGFFNLCTLDFDVAALKKLGIDADILPKIAASGTGYYDNTIPVAIAVGDHQASFLGATHNIAGGAVLINIGTGSQISAECDSYEENNGTMEIRPYFNNKYLKCYSALCGGRAYALMERFIRRVIQQYTGENEEAEQYALMEKLAMERNTSVVCPEVCTAFCGTRSNPEMRGSITGITADNFMPEYFITGVMRGMISELYDNYCLISDDNGKRCIVASGNAVRKNKILRGIIEDYFNVQPILSDIAEEAAAGAAFFAMARSK